MAAESNVHEQRDAHTGKRSRGSEYGAEWYTSFLIKPIDQLTRPFISSAHLYWYICMYVCVRLCTPLDRHNQNM